MASAVRPIGDAISSTEACRLAGMSPERLLRRLRAGAIEGEMLGGRWLVSRASLEAYLARQPAQDGNKN